MKRFYALLVLISALAAALPAAAQISIDEVEAPQESIHFRDRMSAQRGDGDYGSLAR